MKRWNAWEKGCREKTEAAGMENGREKRRLQAGKRDCGFLSAGAAAFLLAGMVAAGSPMTVRAAGGLDMSTDYPGIMAKAGDSLNFSLDFDSLTGQGYDAALSVVSMPEGWEGYFRGSSSDVSRVHIAGEGISEGLATFNLTLPSEVKEGTYHVGLKADAGEGNEDTLELEIVVSQAETGQSNFSSEYPEQEGASGTSFSFDATLVNNKGTEQSYSLSAEAPGGWQVGFVPSGEAAQVASVTVDAGSSKGLTVNITPPESIKEGEYTIPCTAVSAGETLSVELKVRITGSYEVALSTPSGRLSLDAYANDKEEVTLSITNNGNVDLKNLNLTSSAPSGWEVGFSESTIDVLEAGAVKEVTAYLTPDSDALTGDYVVTLSVSCEETSSDAEFRVSVKTRTAWGVLAVLIIAALLAGLGYIFKKYGRR